MLKNLIKKLFNLYDVEDLNNAFSNVTNAKDRDDFEWKLKQNLFRK